MKVVGVVGVVYVVGVVVVVVVVVVVDDIAVVVVWLPCYFLITTDMFKNKRHFWLALNRFVLMYFVANDFVLLCVCLFGLARHVREKISDIIGLWTIKASHVPNI